MAIVPVTHYYARWDVDNHNGHVILYEGDNQVTSFGVDNPEEFRVIVDLLRNERPVRFHEEVRHLRVGGYPDREPVGEEET